MSRSAVRPRRGRAARPGHRDDGAPVPAVTGASAGTDLSTGTEPPTPSTAVSGATARWTTWPTVAPRPWVAPGAVAGADPWLAPRPVPGWILGQTPGWILGQTLGWILGRPGRARRWRRTGPPGPGRPRASRPGGRSGRRCRRCQAGPRRRCRRHPARGLAGVTGPGRATAGGQGGTAAGGQGDAGQPAGGRRQAGREREHGRLRSPRCPWTHDGTPCRTDARGLRCASRCGEPPSAHRA